MIFWGHDIDNRPARRCGILSRQEEAASTEASRTPIVAGQASEQAQTSSAGQAARESATAAVNAAERRSISHTGVLIRSICGDKRRHGDHKAGEASASAGVG
ncbi:hypothetical protein KCP73_23855 [Salmonella enterica subsp. enterica]|nr:hypothetical protein KCP73_23855 [Salmonella enterica subsp. enterica]